MSLNISILTGNIGQDPRFTTTTTGKKKASFSIATTKSVKQQDGSWTKSTEWTPIVAWGRIADRAQKLLSKGLPVLVHGEKRTRTFTDGNGVEHTVVELVAEDFHLLARHKASQEN